MKDDVKEMFDRGIIGVDDLRASIDKASKTYRNLKQDEEEDQK
ncbi:MAG: hypothetical protein ACRD82_06025 [Blastocatellia bacterium]